MMAEGKTYSVSFVKGDEVLFETDVRLKAVLGEPYDSYAMVKKAKGDVFMAIREKRVPDDTYRAADAILIMRADRTSRLEQSDLDALYVAMAEKNRVTLEPHSEIYIIAFGGFTGGRVGKGLTLKLFELNDDDLARVGEIVNEMQKPFPKLERGSCCGDFGYHVYVWPDNSETFSVMEKHGLLTKKPSDYSKDIYKGASFDKTPVLVTELIEMAMRYRRNDPAVASQFNQPKP